MVQMLQLALYVLRAPLQAGIISLYAGITVGTIGILARHRENLAFRKARKNFRIHLVTMTSVHLRAYLRNTQTKLQQLLWNQCTILIQEIIFYNKLKHLLIKMGHF